ncbi:MAG: prepilin-type N-terminal cleavage/methylation domain-containing protein [Candidatus Omnitrophota bacterium]|nr:prepilin-type N-terminal cleavage/methylation domain-containing protein [Candidatus Omnitrophota bacterium]
MINAALKNRKSFTLVELVVVLVIIGILVALAVPRFELAVEDAKIKEAQSVLRSIKGAEKIFRAERGNYVGVDITLAAAAKSPFWATLRIEQVQDTNDWRYGVEVRPPCGCNPGTAGYGSDPQNLRCVPFAQRLRGPNLNRWMHMEMTTGNFPIVGGSVLRAAQCPGAAVTCNNQQ